MRTDTSASVNAEGQVSEQDRLAALILGDSWLLVGATFFGLGLLLAFTPCVFADGADSIGHHRRPGRPGIDGARFRARA